MSTPPNQQRYPFLEILRESEGVARGANISDKVNHAVFKTIQALSTVEAARRNELFTLDVEVPDIVNLDRKSLAQVVQRLIGDRMVAQIFRLEFTPGMPLPAVVSCYIAFPPDEKINPQVLYNETALASVTAIESLLGDLPEVNPEMVRADLAADLETETSRQVKLESSTVDLFSGVHASKFDMVPPPELVQRTIEDIQQELMRRNRVVEVLNYGLMPLKQNEILTRLETAHDFLLQKVIPRYRSRGSLKRLLDAVTSDEAAYEAQRFVPPTADFMKRRAEAVKSTVTADPQYRGGRWQGSLAVEMILALADEAKDKYQEQHQKDNARRFKELRAKIVNASNDWKDVILFMSEDERDEVPPETFRELTADPDIMYTAWHRREGKVHVFIRRDGTALRLLVRSLTEVVPDRAWQVLAVKTAIEAHEEEFKFLFDDPDFVRTYGLMLRGVYIQYIPWWLRMLLSFGLNFFQDYAFQIAKKSIQDQQMVLARRNSELEEQRRQEREAEQKRRTAEARERNLISKIIAALDYFYMEHDRVPSVGEARDYLTDFDDTTFEETLRKGGFQVLPGVGKDAGPRDNILTYAADHEWRSRSARLRRVLDRITGDAGGDPRQVERARRLLKHINKSASGGGGSAPAGPEQGGAYERFGEALDRHEERERRDQPERELATPREGEEHEL